MLTKVKNQIIDTLVPDNLRHLTAFALTTRTKTGQKLGTPIPITKEDTYARFAEVNDKIGALVTVANKAREDFKDMNQCSAEAAKLAKKCTLALEHCAKVSELSDHLYETIVTRTDATLMDRKHASFARRIDEVVRTFSSIIKSICKD